MRIALAIILVASAAPALAVNKCTAADGSVTFQEAPCPNSSKTKEQVRVFAGRGSSSTSVVPLELVGPLGHRGSVAIAALENLKDMSSDCKIKLQVYGIGPDSREPCAAYSRHFDAWFTPATDVVLEMDRSGEYKFQVERAMSFVRRIGDNGNFINLKHGMKSK